MKRIIAILLAGMMSLSSAVNIVMAEENYDIYGGIEETYEMDDDISLFGSYTIDDLKSLLPSGTYWNHKGTSYKDYDNDRNKYNLQSTKQACNHKEFGDTHCSQYGYSGKCG